MAQRVLKDDSGVLTAIDNGGEFRNLAQRLALLYPVNLSLGVMLYKLGQKMAGTASLIQHLHLVDIRELGQCVDDKVDNGKWREELTFRLVDVLGKKTFEQVAKEMVGFA